MIFIIKCFCVYNFFIVFKKKKVIFLGLGNLMKKIESVFCLKSELYNDL